MDGFPDELITSEKGADRIIERLDILSGEKVDDEKRKVGRKYLFSFRRHQGEGLAEYAARLDLAFDQ
eukprot:1685182-Pyramimonas_sp.AAC.1